MAARIKIVLMKHKIFAHLKSVQKIFIYFNHSFLLIYIRNHDVSEIIYASSRYSRSLVIVT